MNRNYIEQDRINLQEQEEMKRSSREIFTGLIDILRVNGKSTYISGGFPFLVRTGLVVDYTASGDQQTVPIKIWSQKDLEKTKRIHVTIKGVGYFQVDREKIMTLRNFVVSKEGEIIPYNMLTGRPDKPSLYPLDIDRISGLQDIVSQIKAELSPDSGNH